MKKLLFAPMFLALAWAPDSRSTVWTQASAGTREAHAVDLTSSAESLTISICDFAQLPERFVAHAMAGIESVFGSAGIEVAWRSCEKQAPAPATPWFVVRLWGEKPSHTNGLGSLDAMGRAFLDQSGTGYLADIHFRSVRDLATLYGCKAEMLLAYAVVHEIGHLLGLEHALRGVMKGVWGVREVQAEGQQMMNFSRQEAARIRKQLRARTGKKQADQSDVPAVSKRACCTPRLSGAPENGD